MSTRLKEAHIEKIAINYLAEHYYAKCSHNKKVVHKVQAHTIEGKRADGIIVWERAPNQVRLVSIEAKSATTISNLKARWDNKKLSKGSLILAEVTIFILFVILYSQFLVRLPLDVPLLFLILFLVYFSRAPFRNFLQNSFAPYFKTASVFQQVNLYPGNEVWIAIGSDTFKKNGTQKLREFIGECKKRKLGLLEVSPNNDLPTILLQPKFKPAYEKKDFLKFYKLDSVLRQSISGPPIISLPKINRSKAELQYYWSQLSNALGLVLLLFFISGSFSDILKQTKTANKSEKIHFSEIADKPTRLPPSTNKEVDLEIPTVFHNVHNDCTFPYKKNKYIIKDKVVDTYRDAKERAALLKSIGFKDSHYFYIPCSNRSKKQDAWCVYAYNPRSDLEIAEEYISNYQYILRKNQLDSSDSEIWHVGEG